MFKVKIIVCAAVIGLVTWAAAVLARDGLQSPDFVPTQIDAVGLLSQAGDLSVETASELRMLSQLDRRDIRYKLDLDREARKPFWEA